MRADTAVPAAVMAGESPEAVLRWANATFPRLAIVASFQAESCVIIDVAARLGMTVPVLTLDTGRLPVETLEMVDRMRARYGMRIEVLSPDGDEVAQMVGAHGADPFYQSADLRRLCCDIRKSRPLERALRGFDAWVTGVRRQQAPTRSQTQVVSEDPVHPGLTKVAPLAAWSRDAVWEYIRAHDVPYHALHDQGYTSIGCAPCTRPTTAGEDERAGRWWWETDEAKECGLHWTPDNRPLPRRGIA